MGLNLRHYLRKQYPYHALGDKKFVPVLKSLWGISNIWITEWKSWQILFNSGGCLHLKIFWNAVVSAIGLVMIKFMS